MTRPCRVRLALLVCVSLGCAAEVAAQPAASPETAVDDARALFAEGLEFVEREDWVQAEDRFRRVLALHSSHVASYNLASALVHLGRLVEASDVLRSILRASDADPPTRDAAQQLLRVTEPRIGSLIVRIGGDMTGAEFTIDGKPLEATERVQTISVDPGEHRVEATRDGQKLAEGRVRMGGGAPLQAEIALELPLRLAPEHAARPARALPVAAHASAEQPARDVDQSESPSWWLWAAGGAAVVAAAIVTAVLVAGGSEATPVAGDTDPPLVRGRVR